MGNLLNLKLWFGLRPGPLMPNYQNALIFLIIILAISFAIFLSFEKNKKEKIYSRLWKQLGSFSLSNFFIGLILLFFTYEAIPFLSSRFWFLVWGIEMAIWLVSVIKKLKDIPKRKEQFEKEKEFKKYIP